MPNVINVVDAFLYEKTRKHIVYENHGIKNLQTFGHAIVKNAFTPLEMHIHKNCIEIVVIVNGIQTYIADDKTFNLTGGDVFISFIDQQHGSGERIQDVSEIFWMQLEMKYDEGFLGLYGDLGRTLFDKINSISESKLKIDKKSIEILRSAFESFSKMTKNDTQIGHSLLITFLNRLTMSCSTSREIDNHYKRVLAFIDQNICENIQIVDLCKMCNLSESRFKHKFTEAVGTAPKQYINYKKIETAKEIIRSKACKSYSTGISQSEEQDVTITDIAMSLSFNSANYFSTVFKKFTGLSPKEYYKSCRNKDITL